MAKCSFCGTQVIQGRGIIFVDMAGNIHNFCSSKCRKNWNLGRDAKRVNWVRKKRK